MDRSTHSFIVNLKKKLKLNQVIATKVDKGQSIVLIHRSDYVTKLQFLTEYGAQESPNFDFDNHVAKVRSTINSNKYLFNNAISTKRALIPNFVHPGLYRLLKVHKPGASMRPVVSFISARVYRLSKRINSWTKSYINHK